DSFKRFMKNENAYIKVYTSEIIKNTIETMLLLGGMKTGRVINEDIIAEEQIQKDNTKRTAMDKRIKEEICIEDGSAMINIYNTLNQIGDKSTVDSIEYAIMEYSE